ncbi:Switch-associated protein 70 [Bagarius yarrelli]|uniref:Switch-associated protein 70 n=1 Tax=Bagarius yarrelli TaxID=175774 RepID=A0A556VCL2_BAGYA|nr:Switch-associated protein 70 [Bagarius yarrelli]
MVHRDEILRPIWHAFSALDVDRKGKVSKSQLKVLSHNLYTVLQIPHQSSELEEHFKDNDEGPVSTQGYMPYLNTFILDRIHGKFDLMELNKMCWTLCARKNINISHMLISDDDAFKVWCIFNFLSEDQYPLVIITEEIEYFLRKLIEAISGNWNEGRFADYKAQLSLKQNCLNVWELIELVGMGYFTKGMDHQTTSIGITEVFNELILDILKQAEQALIEGQMKELQLANEKKQKALEAMGKNLDEAAARAIMEEQRRIRTQMDLQNRYRLLDEEVKKRAELEQIHLQQQRAISQTQQEKEQLEQQRLEQDRTLQMAMQQLESLEQQRQEALQDYEARNKEPQKMTNWGAAAFTDKELETREKIWQEKKKKPDGVL